MNLYVDEKWRVPAIGALSFSLGAGVGYFVCNRRWSKAAEEAVKLAEETTEYLEQAAEDIEKTNKNQLALDFARAAAEQEEHPAVPKHMMTAETTVFNGEMIQIDAPPDDPRGDSDFEVDENWDQAEEEEGRSPDAPYVLHKEEFYAGTSGYLQTSLEYFVADQVLCDENRVPIYNASNVVGRLEFGRGSGDPDTVYIRNEVLKAEYEITRNEGSYQVEVLGVEIEEELEDRDLKHSNTVRKFRMD